MTFKNISLFLCSSLLLLKPVNAQASEKVMSPVSGWELAGGGNDIQNRLCSLSAGFENNVGLSFNAEQGHITSIDIKDSEAAFDAQAIQNVEIFIMPHHTFNLDASVQGNQILRLNTQSMPEIFQHIRNGYIFEIRAPQKTYRFSLTGLKDDLRQLQSCRAQKNVRSLGITNFDSPAATEGGNMRVGALKLSFYPLGNVPEVKGPAPIKTVPAKINANPRVQENVVPVQVERVAAVQPQAVEAVEAKEIVASEPIGEQVASMQQHCSKTITRIHTPGTKMAPQLVEMAPRTMDPIIEHEQALRQPPAFDVEAAQQEIVQREERMDGGPDLSNEQIPNQPSRRIASINDEKASIYWQGGDVGGDIKPVMSQSAAQAKASPTVVPRIDTAQSPQRFDITNRDVARQDPDISNAQLESQLKVTKSMAYDGDLQVATPVMPAPPAPVQNTEIVSSEQVQVATALAPAAKWTAVQGADLREVIANWSIDENVQLVWDTAEQFEVIKGMATSRGYEQAIAGILHQYVLNGYTNRPVGQLYIDPQSGEKMLIITSN